MRFDLVIKKPVISEKSMRLAAIGQFTFVVDKLATKHQIAQVVENHFKVNVVKVATLKVKAKTKRFGKKRQEVKLSDYKKAIVTLKKGQKIDLFDVKE
jgi:large subunit ribosomal protein L23